VAERPQIRIEILTIEGCPNAKIARERVRFALEAEALDAEIFEVEVGSAECAQELRFLGSPSVRVSGRDVEPYTEHAAYGLMCRTYRNGDEVQGAPSVLTIRKALRSRTDLGSKV